MSPVSVGAHHHDRSATRLESVPMSTIVPSAVLIILGASLAVLGLLAAGSLPLIVVGLASVFGAGLLTLASEKRS